MKTSEATTKIIPALITIQQEMHCNKDGNNPHFKSKYATLDNILDTIKPFLKEAELVVMQGTETVDRKIDCTTRVFHSSGEWIESVATVYADKATPQGYGSAITYARRYGLATALGIGLMDDDDANAAETKTTKADAEKERLVELRKAMGKANDALMKLDIMAVHQAFESSGYVSESDDPAEMVRELVKQVNSKEKLATIYRTAKKLHEEINATAEGAKTDG